MAPEGKDAQSTLLASAVGSSLGAWVLGHGHAMNGDRPWADRDSATKDHWGASWMSGFLPPGLYSMYGCCTAGRRQHGDHLSPRKPDHPLGRCSEGRRAATAGGRPMAAGQERGKWGISGHGEETAAVGKPPREASQPPSARGLSTQRDRPCREREFSPVGDQCSAVALSLCPVSPRAGALVAIADVVHVAGSS
jgi:hypothetical protein